MTESMKKLTAGQTDYHAPTVQEKKPRVWRIVATGYPHELVALDDYDTLAAENTALRKQIALCAELTDQHETIIENYESTIASLKQDKDELKIQIRNQAEQLRAAGDLVTRYHNDLAALRARLERATTLASEGADLLRALDCRQGLLSDYKKRIAELGEKGTGNEATKT